MAVLRSAPDDAQKKTTLAAEQDRPGVLKRSLSSYITSNFAPSPQMLIMGYQRVEQTVSAYRAFNGVGHLAIG